MGFFDLMKKRLKKRIRLRRRWLALGIVLLAIGIAAAISFPSAGKPDNNAASTFSFSGTAPESGTLPPNDAFVTLRRVFVCGEEEESLGLMAPEHIRSLQSSHLEWEASVISDREIVFTEYVSDLSDKCKQNSFFGVDAAGRLTLFDGPPKEERVIQTFFQLDIEYLESSLPEHVVQQLKEGIRVTDLESYNSVLSTFSDFAVEETEKVMKIE